MYFILLETNNISPYIPSLMGILGTLLGALLGWLLHLLSDNMEKTYIYIDNISEQQSKYKEYAYIIKLFIYNASHKQLCIRNVRFSFNKSRWKAVFESIPSEGDCSFEIVREKSKEKKDIIFVNSYEQGVYTFSCLIDGQNYERLSEVKKVYLIYKNKKNNLKKKLLKANFKLNSVEQCRETGFL